jgi:hypothetical protein
VIAGILQHRLEGLEVGMDIGNDKVFHGGQIISYTPKMAICLIYSESCILNLGKRLWLKIDMIRGIDGVRRTAK